MKEQQNERITVGVVGLGLIGGSMARAYTAAGHSVLAADTNEAALRAALDSGAVTGELDAKTVGRCDLVLLAVYPGVAIARLRELAPHISATTLVMDLCGTKRQVTSACFDIAAAHGFDYVGGHPMAGT